MKKVKLNSYHIAYKDEISLLYETGVIFDIEIDSIYNRTQKATIEILNLLIKNPIFNEINSVITKQYKISDYFFEINQYLETLIEYSDRGKSFELALESETIDSISMRANFTAKEIKRLSYFRSEYDMENIMSLGPDFNYDIRVIRRAAIDLLYKKISSSDTRYKDLDLSKVHIWDYRFGLA